MKILLQTLNIDLLEYYNTVFITVCDLSFSFFLLFSFSDVFFYFFENKEVEATKPPIDMLSYIK